MQPFASDAYRAECAVRFGVSVFLVICALDWAIAFMRLFNRVPAMQYKLEIVDGMDFVFLERLRVRYKFHFKGKLRLFVSVTYI